MSSSLPMNSLPLYHRFGGGNGPLFCIRRRPFCFREKYVLALAIIAIIFVCYSCIVFLPDEQDPRGVVMTKALKRVMNVDPKAMVVPVPYDYPVDENDQTSRLADSKKRIRVHGMKDSDLDPHRINDRKRLLDKVNQDDQIPKPVPEGRQRELVPIVGEKRVSGNLSSHSILNPSALGVNEQENEKRRETVKQMMILAWDGYEKYAWGANELKPISKVGHSASIFGSSNLGASIIDALDTLYIMGLLDRYEKGRKWVELSFNLYDIRGDLSVFETNIRFLGGLLSCYALTRDEMFVRRAVEVADMLLPAFDTPTGIPYALINPRTKRSKNYGWTTNGASILSEFGSLHLEFEYLSIVTGRAVYKKKVDKIRQVLAELEKPEGFYPIYLHPKTRVWASRHSTLGALGDSFYEYLLKSWLITNKRDGQAKEMYDATIEAVYSKLLLKSKNGLWYIAEWKGSYVDQRMEHLGCFTGGMFALQAVNEQNATLRARQMELGREIGRTCHESYVRTGTHLGPEAFRFNDEMEAEAANDRDKMYILRPEVVETYFYLWRTTKDQKYRDWAWDAVQALEKYCKTESGYSGISNVYAADDPGKDDVQQSFFLAETLKYLYLIFCPDDVIPLDKWVFNTEAHPLPVRFDDSDHVINSSTIDQSAKSGKTPFRVDAAEKAAEHAD